MIIDYPVCSACDSAGIVYVTDTGQWTPCPTCSSERRRLERRAFQSDTVVSDMVVGFDNPGNDDDDIAGDFADLD